jgi:hypothetical protein
LKHKPFALSAKKLSVLCGSITNKMNNIKELIKDKSPEEALALLAKSFQERLCSPLA